MTGENKIEKENFLIIEMISNYLINEPDHINKEMIDNIVRTGVSYEYAFALLLASAFGLDIANNGKHKDFFNNYFIPMIHKLNPKDYYCNPYYKNIKIPSVKCGSSELTFEKYKPFEAFICDDIIVTKEGRQIPQIGFFDTEFKFPALLENGRIWMTITPNEIKTMKEPVEKAFGHVLTYGLGLGYYAYMASEKENVKSVTVVENNEDIILLFKERILPQFNQKEKIKIIHADAFDYANTEMAKGHFDFVFTDLWHDVSDGLDLYLRMKPFEKLCPNTIFSYWIEKSILCYL